MSGGSWRAWVALLALVGVLAAMPAAARTQPPSDAGPRGSFSGERPTFGPRAGGAEFAPGRVIVKYSGEVGTRGQAEVRREADVSKEADLDLVDAEVLDTEGRPVEAVIEDLEADPRVEYAQRDRVVELADYRDEARFGELWGLDNTGQEIRGETGVADVDVDALEASGITRGSEDVVVAVIDDGVDFSHPELAGKQWVNSDEVPNNNIDDDANGYIDDVNGYDFGNDDNTVHDELEDRHGTHVAGTLAAGVNGGGIAGVAPDVRIMAVKIFGPLITTSSIVEGIEYATDNGARISNNSWGYLGTPDPILKEAIARSGQLFVVAAGNDSINNDTGVRFGPRLKVRAYPAAYDLPNILTVAALNNRGRLAEFSNYGRRTTDVSAPGVDVLSSVPATPARSAAALSTVGGGSAATAGFGVDEISGEGARADFVRRSLEAMDFPFCPDPPDTECTARQREILLVDDDLSTAFEGGDIPDAAAPTRAAIEDATAGTPTTIEVVDVGGGDGPSLARMQQADAVVWSTGWAFFSADPEDEAVKKALTFVDQNNLTRYLDGGGRLLLNGMDALFGLENSAFVRDTLGLDVESDYQTATFRGAAGSAFAQTTYEFTNAPNAVPFFHDIVEAAQPNATSLGDGLVPEGYVEYASGTSMAAPHTTGVAALAASRFPELYERPVALKRQVMATGEPARATRGKTLTGRIVDADGAITSTPRRR